MGSRVTVISLRRGPDAISAANNPTTNTPLMSASSSAACRKVPRATNTATPTTAAVKRRVIQGKDGVTVRRSLRFGSYGLGRRSRILGNVDRIQYAVKYAGRANPFDLSFRPHDETVREYDRRGRLDVIRRSKGASVE